MNFEQKQCIDSLEEAEKNFLVASNAYDAISNLHGTHIIDNYLKKYLDPKRCSSESLKQRANSRINKTPNLNFALFEVRG
ncbi:hypothetical protein I6F53_19715 [Pseudoalteromonas sp. SWN29]|uniref:hypothetical protein n=1 Tax=Pseudoalteromonas sp. SWN29 TaxID=2792064 RepID=UPI0018CE736C|nr:hypothetical protein [Pseudoalteromonas sp. SWN29]MBH0029185.1 hypothetical protein [Pseudoalteromonas sp. SWN29]